MFMKLVLFLLSGEQDMKNLLLWDPGSAADCGIRLVLPSAPLEKLSFVSCSFEDRNRTSEPGQWMESKIIVSGKACSCFWPKDVMCYLQ